jgi:murein DD-endopeptidase MepM/ murein hydrolase activator NlpD
MKPAPRILLGLVFGEVLLLAGCGARTPSPPAPSARRSQGAYHVVQPGENLYRIGKAYDISVEELARVNSIMDPRLIHVGQRIFIPGAASQLPVATITPAEAVPASRGPTAPPDGALDNFIVPLSGSINSHFGPRNGSFHDGIDIGAPEGTPILAVADGEVVYSSQLRGYGNLVIVRHASGIVSVYAHNQSNLVREGQKIERGEVVAKVGSTGRVTGPHLHFEIRKNNAAQDPLLYMPQLCCLPASGNVAPKG